MVRFFALFLIGGLLTMSAHAGSIIWSASGLSSEFGGGMAYLVQMTSGSYQTSDIVNYLSNAGTDYQESDFKFWKTASNSQSDGTIINYGEYYYVASVTAEESITTSTDLSNFFVVVINGDNFAVSDFVSDDPIYGDAINWNPSFTDWTTGTFGEVPEPAAAGLLSLGLMALLLRRRR